MQFILKELKLLKKGYLYILGIGLIFSLYTIAIKLDFDHYLYIEGFLSVTLALINADIIYGYGDEKIIISCTKSYISYLFVKFIILLSLFILLLNVHSIIIQLFRGAGSFENLLSQQLILNLDCIVIFGFISTVSIMTSFLTKTSNIAYSIGMIVFLFEAALLKTIIQSHLPKWTWIFSLYGTGRVYPSSEWVLNKLLFSVLTVSFWGIMYISYNYSKKDLIQNNHL